MTTKEYLQQISKLDRLIKCKQTEIDQYRELACSLKSITNEERVQSSPVTFDKIGEKIAKLWELEQEIDKIIDTYIDKKREILDELESLDNENQYMVLFDRFIEKISFEDIAEEIDKSVRQTIRIYNAALAEFEKRYGKKYKNL